MALWMDMIENFKGLGTIWRLSNRGQLSYSIPLVVNRIAASLHGQGLRYSFVGGRSGDLKLHLGRMCALFLLTEYLFEAFCGKWRMRLCFLCSVAQSCLTLCNTMDCSLPGSSVHRDSPGKNTGVGGTKTHLSYLLQSCHYWQILHSEWNDC